MVPAPGNQPRSCPVLVGPTAAGKTELVLQLARRFPLTVVSLDSRQIYRGLRIGTAQPTPAERAACPHRLVDFLSPLRTYSAQQFRRAFARVWRRERRAGRVPLLVGGTGFYLHALQEGLLPVEIPEGALVALRAELDPLPDREIRERLRRLDPESHQRIAPADRYRSQRAVEIALLTGRPLSAWRREQRPRPVLGLRFPVVRLERPVAELDARIAARTGAMLRAGWLEETRHLLQRYPPDCPGLRTLGYAQLVAHLRGELSLEEARGEIVLRTRQYAKRQRTWFRRLAVVAAGPPEAPTVVRTLSRLLEEALEG